VRRRRALLACGLLIVATGCTAGPRDSGFGQVESVAADRAAMQLRWSRATPPDETIGGMVRSMLQGDLTADEAVQIALLNNLSLQATYEELGIAHGELIQASLLSNPTLFGEVRFPGRPRIPFEVDFTQSFLDLLLLPLRKRVAEAQFDATRLRVSDEVLELAAQTRAAYYEAQAAQQVVEMRTTVVEAVDASADVADRMRAAGNITELDLANEQAQRQRAKLELATSEADWLDRREHLNGLMGLWGPDTQWSIAGRLLDIPDSEIGPVGLERLAMEQRLDLAAARREIEATAARVGLTNVATIIPQFVVAGHYEREPEGVGTAGPSLEISIPLFNQGQAVSASGAARLRQAQDRYAALAVAIRTEVRRARNRMWAARRRALYYRDAVLPLQQRIVEQSQLQYNAMQIGVFQLLQARQAQVSAGREYIETLRDYWVARAELERAVGGRLSGRAPAEHDHHAKAEPAAQEGAHHH